MSRYTTFEDAKRARIDIISDEFDSSTGEWNNFVTQDGTTFTAQFDQIKTQKHTDIRSFYPERKIKNYIIFLNELNVGNLLTNQTRVDSIGNFFNFTLSENWTNGNVGNLGSNYNNWYGIELTCLGNQTTTTTSITVDPISLSEYDASEYDKCYISLSLPNLNQAINLSQSSISFTDTDFSNSNNYDTVVFNQINTQLNIDSNRNAELRIPLKLLRETIRQNLKGIKINIYNNSNSSLVFRCLSIRCIYKDPQAGKEWKYAPVDINTQHNIVAYTPSPNGSTALNANWPINENNSNLPTDWPVLYKSFTENRTSDNQPKPVNGGVQVMFNTGSATKAISETEFNDISIYFRNELRDPQQIDLTGLTQESLDSFNDFSELFKTYLVGRQKNYSKIPGKILLKTALSFAISDSSTEIVVDDASYADSSGLMIIGNERIEYSSRLGNTITAVVRGHEDTDPASHIIGTPVWLPFTLRQPTDVFGQSSLVRLTQNITDTDTEITVDDTGQFPPSGVIYIDNEYIKYNGRTTNQFLNCERGHISSVAAEHSIFSKVHYYTQINRKGLSVWPPQQGQTQLQMEGRTTGAPDEPRTRTQSQLMYISEITQVSYVKISFQWYQGVKAKIIVSDENGAENHIFNIPSELIKQNVNYVFTPSIENQKFRVKIGSIYNNEALDTNYITPVYDTGWIESPFLKRKRGQFGWSAQFLDGDAYIQSIRSNGMTYAEIRSSSKNSRTPVKGVQAFIDGTHYSESLTQILNSPFNQINSTVKKDNKKSGSNQCYEVSNFKGIWQGIATNQFTIDNFNDIQIEFLIYTQSSFQNIKGLLYNKQRNSIIPVGIPSFNPNQWQELKIQINGEDHLSGSYQFILAEELTTDRSTWWIDNLSIKKFEMQWYGRSYSNGINEIGADNWMPMSSVINDIDNGTVFNVAGKELQIKGSAKSQFVELYEFKFVPKYATLGNFIKDRK